MARMINVRVNVREMAQLRNTVGGIRQGYYEEAAREHERIARIVAAGARIIGPRRSGRLVGSLKVSGTGFDAVVSTDLIYGPVIHWGWPSRTPDRRRRIWGGPIEANPFIRDAAYLTEMDWTDDYAGFLQSIVDRSRR